MMVLSAPRAEGGRVAGAHLRRAAAAGSRPGSWSRSRRPRTARHRTRRAVVPSGGRRGPCWHRRRLSLPSALDAAAERGWCRRALPQQNCLLAEPFCLPAQSAAQVRQFSPLPASHRRFVPAGQSGMSSMSATNGLTCDRNVSVKDPARRLSPGFRAIHYPVVTPDLPLKR